MSGFPLRIQHSRQNHADGASPKNSRSLKTDTEASPTDLTFVLGGVLLERFHRVRLVGLFYVCSGVFTAALPWCTSLGTLIAVMLANGISMGMVDTGESMRRTARNTETFPPLSLVTFSLGPCSGFISLSGAFSCLHGSLDPRTAPSFRPGSVNPSFSPSAPRH